MIAAMGTNNYTAQAEALKRKASEATDPAIREEYLKLAESLTQMASQQEHDEASAAELDALAEGMVGNTKSTL
jgi:hypothetical protein